MLNIGEINGGFIVTGLFGYCEELFEHLAPHFDTVQQVLKDKKQREEYLPGIPPNVVRRLLSRTEDEQLSFFANLWIVTKLSITPVGEYKYNPQEDSPIRISFELPDGKQVAVYDGLTKKVYKVRQIDPAIVDSNPARA